MNYTPITVSLEKLRLDPENPRFVNIPNPDEESIKDYLVDNEDVLSIVRGINQDEGLMPGERIIVAKEGNEYVVLEGNRRICACKLLAGMLTTNKKIAVATQNTLKNISTINVDLVDNRATVQSALYRRHIKGIKSWPTQAKLFFFARRFFNNESVSDIKKDTPDTTERKIKDYIQKYNLLQYTLNVSNWTDEEKDNLDRTELEVDRFLRIFTSKSKKYKKNARQLLNISYDEKTLEPKSDLAKDIFDEALYILAKAAFLTRELDTRKHVEDVGDFVELYDDILALVTTSSIPGGDTDSPSGKDTGSPSGNDSGSPSSNDSGSPSSNDSGSPSGNDSGSPSGNDIDGSARPGVKDPNDSPQPPVFFSMLTWRLLKPSEPEDLGIIHLANEIQRLSEKPSGKRDPYYVLFPTATTIILRSLLEQGIKYYIKKMKKWNELMEYLSNKNSKNKDIATMDPSMSQIISYLRSNNNFKFLFPEKKLQEAYQQAVLHIAYMDTVVHTAEMFTPNRNKLESIANDGAYSLISYILNNDKHWPRE